MAFDSDSRVAGALIAGIVGALVAGALALSSLAGGGSALDDAAVMHAADMTVAGQDVAMSAIGQSILMAESAASGTASPADAVAAVAEAEVAIARVQLAFASLPDPVQTQLAAEFARWETEAEEVVDLLASGDHIPVLSTLDVSLAPAADALAAGLLDERDARSIAVADVEGGLGLVARLAGFLVVFLLPLVAILVYRESARRQLQAAATHLEARLEADNASGKGKGQLVAEFASTMQVPLASINEFCDLLMTGDSSPDQVRDLVGLIHGHSEELSNQVDDVLAATRSLAPPATATLEMADQIDAAIQAIARQGHEIGGTYGVGTVDADPARVQHILRNLLSNAIAHGGPKVGVFGDVAGSRYVIAVEDNGSGLPDHVADQFAAGIAPLETEDGLGLAVARELAETMEGSVEYDRVAGRTTFILSLPLAEELVEAPASGDLLIAAKQ